jgi:hypothetical protein
LIVEKHTGNGRYNQGGIDRRGVSIIEGSELKLKCSNAKALRRRARTGLDLERKSDAGANQHDENEPTHNHGPSHHRSLAFPPAPNEPSPTQSVADA